MTVKNLAEEFHFEVLTGKTGLDREISGGYTSDLLSDVMGKAREGQIWITIQAHVNVAAIAGLKELSAVLLAGGHQPDEEMQEKCLEEGIPILRSDLPVFELSGKVYEWLNS